MPKFRVEFDVEADKIEDVAEFMRCGIDTIQAEMQYNVKMNTAWIEPWVVWDR